MNNTELLPFDSDLHEDLFKLMIFFTQQDKFLMAWHNHLEAIDKDYVDTIIDQFYKLSFEDRSIVEDRFIWCEFTGRFHKV